MRMEKIESFEALGLTIRTNNHDEMKTSGLKIGQLWQDFYSQVAPKLSSSSAVYGVYHNYESDHLGDFDVTACATNLSDNSEFGTNIVKSGEYLVFSNKGKMPEMVVACWQQVWAFFADENCEYDRAYDTDFEKYLSEEEVEIYIGVLPKS
ncbi:putative Bacterial transcription activator [Vibrio nigripulchritudo SOn1]|uniref:Bacterial transcription activator n=1 Tax=Vibrio nigripulchritudo SOn1 TaxID=1238450 RepID=A0AAV2VLF1_9VIBR|nr:GyrI-like domain-containing protein [Vibrio nigripulchritudo]CCO45470.1 putative Bacterial transcription activator [Vibrio nigripulchritudo SOn1]